MLSSEHAARKKDSSQGCAVGAVRGDVERCIWGIGIAVSNRFLVYIFLSGNAWSCLMLSGRLPRLAARYK